MYSLITGNLLEHNAQYIAHQCNCVSNGSAGLARAIYGRYPYSNIYATRKKTSKMGSIDIAGNGEDKRYVINMFSQYYPGKCKYPGNIDNAYLRANAFQSCLNKISKIDNLESIAFPYEIGCGLAGGDWKEYEKMISDFAKNNFLTDVYVVRLP